TFSADTDFTPVHGAEGLITSGADTRLSVEVAPLSAVVYRASAPAPGSKSPPELSLSGGELTGRAEITAEVAPPESGIMPFVQVTFAARPTGSDAEWQVLGTDDQ